MTNDQPTVAELRIVLKAGDAVVAESLDQRLWQQTLAAITGIKAPEQTNPPAPPPPLHEQGSENTRIPPDQIETLAREIGVSRNVVIGACGPSSTPPFIHLDAHSWEALKNNTPTRGRGSVSASRLAATLLVLWSRIAGLGNPTSGQIQAVVDTIGVAEKNLMRGIRNCEWLQVRGDGVLLNPSQTSQALKLARAYCARTPFGENTGT